MNYYKTGGDMGRGGNRLDPARQMARARAYLNKMAVSVSGSNGHGALLKATCAMWNGFALSEDETLELLREWNARCMPPWEERDLVHKVNEASGKTGNVQHREPRGHLLGERGAHAAAASAKPVPSSQSRTLKIVRKPLPGTLAGPASPARGVPSIESIGAICERLVPLVPVVGCRVGRPPEIAVDDDTWRTLDASGFAAEPQIQHALFLFGPGPRVRVEGSSNP